MKPRSEVVVSGSKNIGNFLEQGITKCAPLSGSATLEILGGFKTDQKIKPRCSSL